MAIIIEEKRDSGILASLLIWIITLGIITTSVYYIFFKKPELVEFTASPSLNNIQELAKISINSDKLINDSVFQSLEKYIDAPEPKNIGRTNPFLGF
ncbi:MAG: hypothetical protein HY432_02640 [Candidatus Liptonbacteria bacterium]|nr:hypothetical protein [Candidatus Liptonbacteria bacterium]